jgi:hypothetical protein
MVRKDNKQKRGTFKLAQIGDELKKYLRASLPCNYGNEIEAWFFELIVLAPSSLAEAYEPFGLQSASLAMRQK